MANKDQVLNNLNLKVKKDFWVAFGFFSFTYFQSREKSQVLFCLFFFFPLNYYVEFSKSGGCFIRSQDEGANQSLKSHFKISLFL